MKKEAQEILDSIPEQRCEKCKWYKMIDSGYGYCKRFPPLNTIKSVLPRLKIDIEYTVVPWTQDICGEFNPR